jgi:hypothetical protein
MRTPCLICGVTPKRLHSDHCHQHDRQRGRICPRCNALMGRIDGGSIPRNITPDLLRNLREHADRCLDCVAGNPANAKASYQLNTAIPDDLAASLRSWADERGISIAAAVRIILHQALGGAAATC